MIISYIGIFILKKPLTEAGTREFHVSGPWADPKVEPVQRKLFDELPGGVTAPASSLPAASSAKP